MHKRDLVLVLGGRLINVLVTLISMRVSTNFLDPAQYGELALLLAIQVFCGLFLINPISQHISIHTHTWWDDNTLLARLNAYRRYVLLVACIGALIVLSINASKLSYGVAITAAVMLALVAAGTWNTTKIPTLSMLGFRVESVGWASLTLVVCLVTSSMLVLWIPTATAWLAGQAVGLLAGAIGASRALRKHSRLPYEQPSVMRLLDRQTLLSYCLPLAIGTGFMWLQLSGYRFLIEKYWGLAQLGFLAIGLAVAGQIAALVESFVMQFVYPYFFRRISGADSIAGQAAMSDLLNALGPSYVLLAGATVLGAPHLLLLLVDAKYADAVIFVSMGAAIESCRMLGNLAGNAAQITRQTSSLAAPYAMGALTVCGLIIGFGGEGLSINYACWSLVAGALVMLLVMLFMMYRQVRFKIAPLPWSIATVSMLAMVMLGVAHQTSHGLLDAVLRLAGIATIVVAAQMLLLWRNPAMSRLLSVQLRKS